METQHSISDLIVHSFEQKPIEFKNSFEFLLNDKINDAIGERKKELGNSIFGDNGEDNG